MSLNRIDFIEERLKRLEHILGIVKPIIDNENNDLKLESIKIDLKADIKSVSESEYESSLEEYKHKIKRDKRNGRFKSQK